MRKNPILISLHTLCSLFVIIGNPDYSQATSLEKVQYLYPTNNDKAFDETADEFYQALRDRRYPPHREFYVKYKQRQRDLNNGLFKDFSNASVNIRKKGLFREVEAFNYITWDGNIHYTYPDMDIKDHPAISPDRQVYFFYSFIDTEMEFRGRYAIYDVETKQILAGGGTYIPKYPIYKKHLQEKGERGNN